MRPVANRSPVNPDRGSIPLLSVMKEPQDKRAKWCCWDCDGKRSVAKLYRRSRKHWKRYLREVSKKRNR